MCVCPQVSNARPPLSRSDKCPEQLRVQSTGGTSECYARREGSSWEGPALPRDRKLRPVTSSGCDVEQTAGPIKQTTTNVCRVAKTGWLSKPIVTPEAGAGSPLPEWSALLQPVKVPSSLGPQTPRATRKRTSQLPIGAGPGQKFSSFLLLLLFHQHGNYWVPIPF